MSNIKVGQQVRVEAKGDTNGKHGTVRFIGTTHFAGGEWVGVELEDASGKNDGSIGGERYFDCEPARGVFIRPPSLTVVRDAPARPTARPARSSVAAPAGGRRPSTVTDPAAARRMSINAPSPSPVPRSRPSSIARSPTRPERPPPASSATSSTTPSRTTTPSGAFGRTSSVGGTRPRPSVAPTTKRTSMGPPALPPPSARPARPSSTSSITKSTTTRPAAARLSTTGATRGAVTRPAGSRVRSGDSLSGNESGTSRSALASPTKSDEDISPVQARTQALNRLTAGPTSKAKPTVAKSTPTSAKTSAAANSAASRENADLKSKLNILQEKRTEDREKMKDLQKLADQADRFATVNKKLEEKLKITTQEVASLRKQLKETEERLAGVDDMQAEHESMMELATLDREMAEETADALKFELEAVKQKLEELELEVDILREENAGYEEGVTTEDRATENWMNLQKKNELYHRALVALHEKSETQKEEMGADIKALQQDLEDFDKVKQEYDICKERLLMSEDKVEDLKEQLDNALGAEELIEKLSDENAQHNDTIAQLRDNIKDLEELKEINDELEINHLEHEKELEKIIDSKDTVIFRQNQQLTEQNKDLDDMQYTVVKFKELVTNLQRDLEDMEASHALNEAESEQLNSKSRDLLDLNHKLQISAEKTQVKTLDLELQRIDAEEAKLHLQIVQFFLPDSYDQDKLSVHAVLRFSRLASKARMVQGFVKERISGQAHPGHEDDVFAGCDALHKLNWVATMCDRFFAAISHCSLEEFAKYENVLFDLEPVERTLNGYIDSLKRGDFKEQQCAQELSRTIAVLTDLSEKHIPESLESVADKFQMQTTMMQSYLESASTTLSVVKAMVQRVLPTGGENDESYQYFGLTTDTVISQTRTAKVFASKAHRSLEDHKARKMTLDPQEADVFEECESAARQLANMAQAVALDLHTLTSEEGRAEPLTYDEVKETMHQTALRVFSSSEGGLWSAYVSRIRALSAQLTDLATVCGDLSQTQEFDLSTEPWVLRSQELKAQKVQPVDVEEQLLQLKEQYNEARLAVAVREESLSTSALRIETLEARMRDANTKASRITDLEAQILDAQASMSKLKEDIEKQDRELKTLETDRDTWKKVAGETRVLSGDAGSTKAGREQAVATQREMDALRNDIASLQAAVRYLREDNRRARTTEQHAYNWLSEPLKKPTPVAEQRRALVVAEGKDVLGELLKMAGSAKVYDLKKLPEDRMAWRPAKTTPQYHAAKQAEDLAAWKSWQNAVVGKAKVVVGAQNGRREASEHREAMRKAAARLRIRLPDEEGKTILGRGEVQIAGSAEWEGLQGRLGVVV
ncbi:uncharacterized protein JN550_007719 [Neoarthrinium moseri]|uniref:uncharacterized protein n=1 Tax=Neoarthrinium moseri TaxID=1658444 RepID=UPI001FDC4849|nr:uncharacterized protein JN550_007719 [Neoarthrinium moseri]KAI1866331.1 hypothetical protein JN550_007719 [Neoarthrinium moseri]